MRNFQKNIWLWTAVNRATKQIVGFQIGTRETKHFQKLSSKIRYIDTKLYSIDLWHSYKFIDPTKHLTGKEYTYIVERMNMLLRQYLARFARKTYYYSKRLPMLKRPLLLLIHRDFI